jgi:hypothetical protein
MSSDKPNKKQKELKKPLIERIEEGTTILKKLNDIGVPDTVPGYSDLKTQLETWMDGGPTWQGKIQFPSFGRTAHILLPTKIGCKATLAFKLDDGSGLKNPPAKL